MKLTPKANQAIIPVKKQELAAFLHDLFDTPKGEPVKLSRKEFTGRFIFSLRKYSAIPVEQEVPAGWFPVVVEFPKSEFSHSDRYFNWFSIECIEQINDFVQAAFDLYFHVYFFDQSDLATFGCKEYGGAEFTKMLLVDSFVLGLNIVDLDTATETIKKREYRKEVELLRRKRASFLQKDLRYRKNIYKKRRENLQKVMKQ